jgi:predicted RNA-binding protein with PIN domain
VDGHNVLHAWGWIKEGEVHARARLIEALRAIHDVEGIDVTVVFDAPGEVSTADPSVTGDGFLVVYAAASLSADGVIERKVASDSQPTRCVVATGDTLIRGNVLAAGGECLPPDELRAWIERCRARAAGTLRNRQAAQRAKFGNKLPL